MNDEVTKSTACGRIDLSDLGISALEAAEQRLALSTFEEDWERPEMRVYDDA